jgi:phosphotransferase system enzyme I (PtsI)
MFKGISASPGVAIGEALVYKVEALNIMMSSILNIEDELERLQSSVEASKFQLEEIKAETEKKLGMDAAAIFEAHIMILEDQEFILQIRNKIVEEKVCAAYAANEAIEAYASIFEAMEDEYLKERAADIRDIGTRLLKNLMGIEIINLSNLSEESILVAPDLAPSDIATMNVEKVLGIITEIGGSTSHTAIMARTLGIPAIVGLKSIVKEVNNGDVIAFDGEEGIVYINPDNKTLDVYHSKKMEYKLRRNELIILKNQPTISKDNRRVELACNIGIPKDVEAVLENGGEGIGLYRTEFLYMNRNSMPSEDEQYEAYKEVLEKMEGRPVIIRTLDIGGDKELSYLNLPKEMNPFLGYRAIRICLDQPQIFRTQLKALLRASVYGNLKLMYPMISSVEEVRAANDILNQVKRELDDEFIQYSKEIEVGIMIEIPAAAVIGDLLIKEVDFFSIGTNDLIQYSIAVDRTNEKISYLYEPFHPAILRLIKMVIDFAHKDGKWVGMCGEMAGDLKIIPVLLGLGLDEFSMSASSILPARKLIGELSYCEMKQIAEKALMLPTSGAVKNYFNK